MEKKTKTFSSIILITITIAILLFISESQAKPLKKEIRNLISEAKDLRTITIVKLPKKEYYKEGELLDIKGMIINATYSDGTKTKITDYIIDKTQPLTIYDSKVTISYEGKTASFNIKIVNDEDIEIYPNPSEKKYTVELKEDKITRFEVEDSDLSKWIISDEDEGLDKKIIKSNSSSRKAYVSGMGDNIIEGRKLIFNLDLNFNATIEMSVSYYQNEKSKQYDIGISSVYNIFINDNKNIGVDGENIVRDKKQWQIIKYKQFNLQKGKHTISINVKSDIKYGTPNIDYIDFKSQKIGEVPIDPDINDMPLNDFHTLIQYQYITDDPLNILSYARGIEDLSRPKGNLLDFSDSIHENSDSYVIQISSSPYFNTSDTKTIENLNKTQYIIKNLKLGQTIFYRGGINKNDVKSSKAYYELTVNTLAPRNLDIPGVDNARDIGGVKSYLVENGKIRQGLYFRSAKTNHATKEGKRIIAQDLGIKVEIDLRDASEAKGPYIDGVDYYAIPIESESGSKFDDFKDEFKKVFDLMSKADEKPIILHCAAGADRTGIMTFALMTLLGCEHDDVFRDYLFTNFAAQEIREVNSDITRWWKNLDKYDGETKAEQAKKWLMKSKEIKEEKLEHIREIFIENYKTKKIK